MPANHLIRNEAEVEVIRAIANGSDDRPITMLNLNRYRTAAAYPDGALYRNYMTVLEQLLPKVGGKILWRSPVLGQAVGEQPLDEILAAWYPSHQAFLDLRNVAGAAENYQLRDQSVEYAVIHRCPGDLEGLKP